MYVFENSRAVIARGCGVKNAGWRGLYVDNGWAYARETVWSGSGFAGGPEGVSGGIRGSNQSNCMVRQVDCTNCVTGAYFSDCYANISDSDFSGATVIGVAAHAGAVVYGGGIIANNCDIGFQATNGGKLVSGESSNTDGIFPSATNCATNAVNVDDGGEIILEKPTLTSTVGPAMQITNGRVRLSAGSARSTAAGSNGRAATIAEGGELIAIGSTLRGDGSWALRLYNGSCANVYNGRLEGASGEIEVNGGSNVQAGGALRIDDVSAIRTNVNIGEMSATGMIFGIEGGGTLVRSTDAAYAVSNTDPQNILVSANLTQSRNYSMYDSTGLLDRAHTITYTGTGGRVRIYSEPANTNVLATLATNESATVRPNGAGGWTVVSLGLRSKRAALSNSNASLFVTTGDYMYPAASVSSTISYTMPGSSDLSARPMKFSRTDVGAGTWNIYQSDGTTLVVALTPGQWAELVPLANGSNWYVATKGSLT